jgi:hypothetical protein
MYGGAREISAGKAASIISGTLKLVAPAAEPLKFLQTIEDSSALFRPGLRSHFQRFRQPEGPDADVPFF